LQFSRRSWRHPAALCTHAGSRGLTHVGGKPAQASFKSITRWEVWEIGT
jgi:hypothetical protein